MGDPTIQDCIDNLEQEKAKLESVEENIMDVIDNAAWVIHESVLDAFPEKLRPLADFKVEGELPDFIFKFGNISTYLLMVGREEDAVLCDIGATRYKTIPDIEGKVFLLELRDETIHIIFPESTIRIDFWTRSGVFKVETTEINEINLL